jgi:hypothetical protein
MNISETISSNITPILSGLTAVIGACAGWYASKKKEAREDKAAEVNERTLMQTQFEALMVANASFRTEVRADLDKTKVELASAHREIEQLRVELKSKDILIVQLQGQVITLNQQIVILTNRQNG